MFDAELRRGFEEGLSGGGEGRGACLDADLDALAFELADDAPSYSVVERYTSTCSSLSGSTLGGLESSSSVTPVDTGEQDSTEPLTKSIWRSYSFEIVPILDMRDKTSNSLLAELRESTSRWDRNGNAVDYRSVRKRSCSIAIEINCRARTQPQIAPRFRPERRPAHQCTTPDDRALSRDRQVIDLHWLWCTGHRKIPDSREYVHLFGDEEFNFQLASKFACEQWTPARKVECLGLDAQTEWQLAAIQSREFQKKWDAIWRRRPHIERRFLDSLATRRASKGHVEEWLQLWTAHQMVGESPERICRLLPFVSGEPAKDPSGISKRLGRMLQRIQRH